MKEITRNEYTSKLNKYIEMSRHKLDAAMNSLSRDDMVAVMQITAQEGLISQINQYTNNVSILASLGLTDEHDKDIHYIENSETGMLFRFNKHEYELGVSCGDIDTEHTKSTANKIDRDKYRDVA